MNQQLITAAEHQAGLIQRDIFTPTTKSLNHVGIILMWICMVLMPVMVYSHSTLVRVVCFAIYTLTYFVYMMAERKDAIFEYLPVQPNHLGRKLIFTVAFSTMAVGIFYLAFLDSQAAGFVLSVVGLVIASAATAMRFIGIQE